MSSKKREGAQLHQAMRRILSESACHNELWTERQDFPSLVSMVSVILTFSNSAAVNRLSSTIGLARVWIHDAAQVWARMWYPVSMAPEVAQLGPLTTDNEQRGSCAQCRPAFPGTRRFPA